MQTIAPSSIVKPCESAELLPYHSRCFTHNLPRHSFTTFYATLLKQSSLLRHDSHPTLLCRHRLRFHLRFYHARVASCLQPRYPPFFATRQHRTETAV